MNHELNVEKKRRELAVRKDKDELTKLKEKRAKHAGKDRKRTQNQEEETNEVADDIDAHKMVVTETDEERIRKIKSRKVVFAHHI